MWSNQSITDMHKDTHTLFRKMIIEVENKTAGKSKAIGMPIKFSETNDEQSKGHLYLVSIQILFLKILDIPRSK